jgi:choline-sulfatase
VLRFPRSLLLLTCLVVACRYEPAAPPAPRPDIILITIDTLRADRVGRGLTPALDSLAQRGVRFTNARTAVPLTLPSHVTIMTGALPPAHGVRENGVTFKPGPPPLARVLHDSGYSTAAFVGAYVLDHRFGLADGFDVYNDEIKRDPERALRLEAERRGEEVVNAALKWLPTAKRPFFLWVHLYDPHAPYDPPPDWRAKAGGNAYDGEVAYADAQIGRLLDGLKGRGPLDSSFIVAAGDHGEGLGEHGEDTHGMLAYDSTLRVPLVAASPQLRARTLASPVSLADLAPSVLHQIGLGDRARAVDVFADRSPTRDSYAETLYPATAGWHPIQVLATSRWKLVSSSEAELYDVDADPGETRNLAASTPGVVRQLTSALGNLEQSGGTATAPAVSPEAAERLRSLGYVGGSTQSSADSDGPNPAAVIDGWRQFERALALVNTGRARDALPALQALAARFPSGPVFQTTYAQALMKSGKATAALERYRAAAARWPNDALMFHDMAVAARAAGQIDEARRAEQAALALDSTSAAAMNGLGLLEVDAGRPAEAATAFTRAANADPSNASYWTNLGNARRALGDVAGAESAYRRALDADATYADAANGLGVLLVQQRKAADAIPWFERALQSSPDFYEARLNLGIAYQQSGDRAKAAAVYRDILSKAPPRFARERKGAAELLRQVR